jgi:hypothetical protein
MVADTADGADGVVGLVFACGRYPDRPRSQPRLAAEDNLNPERNHGIASHLGGAGRLEKVECASRPFVQCARSAMISRTRVATGSASTMVSIASRRLLK